MNIFAAVKYCCILHGRVCVMGSKIAIKRICNILQFLTTLEMISSDEICDIILIFTRTIECGYTCKSHFYNIEVGCVGINHNELS